MITDGNKWHYLTVSHLSALLEGKVSNHPGYFYCLNCLIHIPQRINLKNVNKYTINTAAAVQKCLSSLKKY